MSHFTVLVVTDNGVQEEIESALQPFHEYECTGTLDEYVVFVSEDKPKAEFVEEWESEHKEDYETFEEFLNGYHGYIEKEGKIGRMTNPNAKWDWWQVGGRWSGMLMLKGEYSEALRHMAALEKRGKPIPDSLKEKIKGIAMGDRSWMNQDEEIPNFMVDSARKDQIDFEGKIKQAQEEAKAEYAKFHEILAGREFVTWKDCLAEFENEAAKAESSSDEPSESTEVAVADTRTPMDKAREKYHGQEVLKDITGAFGPFLQIEDYLGSEEDFISKRGVQGISTFAVLYNNEWLQKGEMGWFAMVSNEDKSWADNYQSILDNIPDDKFLTVVDCHI